MQCDPCAPVVDSPITASNWKSIIKIISPLDTSAKRNKAHERQSPDEHNEAYVDDPENAMPSVALFLLFNDLLCAENFSGVLYKLLTLSDFAIAVHHNAGITGSMASFLVFNVEVEVEPASNDSDY